MKVAIIDLYDGEVNAGIPSITQMLQEMGHTYQIFPFRSNREWPKLSEWDAIISSGGPGDPTTEAPWSQDWKKLMQSIMDYNLENEVTISVFLICYSFQLFCHHFELGESSPRHKPSFGPTYCHLTEEGRTHPIFGKLPERFQVADFRHFQITQANQEKLAQMGGHILALEKQRDHIKRERALMAIQFTQNILGTQFHPEADGQTLKKMFLKDPQKFIDLLGPKQYAKIKQKINDVQGILETHSIVLPYYLRFANKE